MFKLIFKIIFILIIGGIGGLLMEHVALPYITNAGPLSQISWLKNLASLTTIISTTEEIHIEDK